MSPKVEPLLPIYHQKPFPFIKLCKKYLPFITISILVTLSLLCYLFVPQIRITSKQFGQRWGSGLSFGDRTSNRPKISVIDVSQLRSSDNLNSNNNNFNTNYNNFNANDRRVINEYNPNGNDSEGLRTGRALELPSGDDPSPTVRAQRDFVKDMMRHSWDNYVRYAWAENELKPMSRKGHTSDIFGGDHRLGATIVDALDTLYIMNMTQEFRKGRDWVAESLSINTVNNDMSVFETTIRFVGGLLASYALTNDPMFLSKARHVADHMLPAFNTPTGLPLALINPMSGKAHNYGWASGGSSILSEIGTLDLEFVYLSAASGATIYEEKVTKIRQFLDKIVKPYDGLYINYINPFEGNWGEDQISIGALGDSYYEYLIKSWIQTNGTDVMARRMYDRAVEAIDRQLVQKSRNGLIYLAKMNSGKLEHRMEHLTCFSGGMFALGAQGLNDQLYRDHFMSLGAGITDTCAQSYLRTATHIGPDSFGFTDTEEAVALNNYERHYILRPEVIESYFYLWRLTHDQRFRDYAWSAAQAIGQHCRTDSGFSGIRNTSDINSAKDDVQQTFFLAETLKYLYLIFSSDDLIDLNHWVFNTEGHPLPVLRHLDPNPSRNH